MGSAMQSLYSANPTKPPGQQQGQGQQPSWGGGQGGQRPSWAQQPTFSSMQQQGQSRPAPPQSWYSYQPGQSSTSSSSTSPGQTQGYRPPQAPQQPSYAPQPSYGTQPPQSPWQGGPSGYSQPQAPQSPQSAPPSYQQPSYGGPPIGYNQPQAPQNWTPPTQQGASPYAPPQAPPQGMSASAPGQQYGSGPAATSQTQNTANQLGGATQNLLLNQLQNPNGAMGTPAAQNLLQQQLANPSPLGSQAYQAQSQMAQTQLNEQYQQQQDAINSNLASRGVYDSSLAGGYLSDLNTSQGRQMASIQANLLPQEAQLQLQGTNSALGNAQSYSGQNTSNISNALANSMGYGGQQFSNQYQTAQMNLLQQAQQNGQLQSMLGLTGT